MQHFRKGLPLLITAILIFAFLGVSILNYAVTRVAIREEILRKDLPLTMDNIYSELLTIMTKPLLVSSSMAANTFLKDWAMNGEKNPERVIAYLEQLREKYNFFTAFFVSAVSHKYYRYNGVHKIIAKEDMHDIWFYDFVASGKEYDFDIDSDEAGNGLLTIFVNYRIKGADGSLLGVTGVGLRVDNVAGKIGEYHEKYGRTVYLTDTHGIIQVHPDTTLIEKARIQDLPGIRTTAEQILASQSGHANYSFSRNGQQILLTVRYIPSLQWFLFVEQSMTKTLATAKKNLVTTLLIGAAVSALVIIATVVTVNRYQARIEALVITDELTGAGNRRALELEFNRAKYNYQRHNSGFCMMIFDLDLFKQVNDMLGHVMGNEYLITLVKMLNGIIRPTDTLVRWGGDEFVLLFNGSLDDCMMIAERIRHAVANDIPGGPQHVDDPRNKITLSGGITAFMDNDDLESMLRRADQAMYRSKKGGGNMVEPVS